MEKILSSRTKVRFQDCDPFNHLNNARYADYFINAREDQILDHYDLDIVRHTKQTGKSWVVTTSQTQFLKPALLQEEVLLKSALVFCNSKLLHIEMTMWNHDSSQLKAISWMKFVYIDIRNNKVTDHEPELMTLFKQVESPIAEKVFEERCKVLTSSSLSSINSVNTIKNL